MFPIKYIIIFIYTCYNMEVSIIVPLYIEEKNNKSLHITHCLLHIAYNVQKKLISIF